MNLNQTSCYAMAMLPVLVAPVLGAAGEKSARFRVDAHAQVTSPITGVNAGPAMGHRTWSPPIT
jgi:hypothetical protein